MKRKELERLHIVVYEAYMAGQARGENTEEILEALSQKFDRTPRQIQNWIYSVDKKRKAKPYEETPHKQKMRNLAEALINEIESLMTSDSFMLDLKPGQLYLRGQKLPVITIEEDETRVMLFIEGKGDIDLIYKALRTHLETGGFTNVLSDITSWSAGMADNLKKYHELFATVHKKLERTYDTSIAVSVPIDRKSQFIFSQPGFTLYFPLLICASALEQARGSSDYIDCTYRREGLNLKFGVYTIYIGTSDEHMQLFEDTHREWRARCAMWKQTKATAKQRQNLDKAATAINEELQKFINIERLPGHCELCS